MRTFFILGILAALLGILGYALYRTTEEVPHPSSKLHIIVSSYPLEFVVRSIAGSYAFVETVTPPGVEPHDFEPTLKRIASLGDADMFVYVGSGFEPWITRWTEGNFPRPRQTLDMSQRLSREGVHLIVRGQTIDPHVWLDPTILREEARILVAELSRLDPEHKDAYDAGGSTLSQELDSLNQEFRETLGGCALQEVVVSHDAFEYLARAYGFETISIAGISPDEEPSSKTLAEIVDIVRTHHLPVVFFESTVSPKLAETIARESGARSVLLHTLESLNVSEVESGYDYLSLMRQNLTALKDALLCTSTKNS